MEIQEIGFGLRALERVGKPDSVKRQSEVLLVLVFSWPLLTVRKI